MAQIGQYQLGAFASPVNGGSLDATVVRGNDNAIVGVHDNHDNDPTIHVQSFPFASLPSASTLGRFLIANDTFRAYFDTGSVLQELAYLSKAGGTLTGPITLSGVNRLTGSGGAGTTVAAWRFGDTNSGTSRDWSISNGYGAGAAAIGNLVFAHSAAANGDPIASGASIVAQMTVSGMMISGTLSATGNVTFQGTAAITSNTTIGGTLGVTGVLTASAGVTGDVTGNVTGNVSGSSGSTTGNAATATALQTARTINGVSFNGTANITVPAAAGTLTGATLASGVTASSLTSVGTLATLTVTGNTTVGKLKGGSSAPTLSGIPSGWAGSISGSDSGGVITLVANGTNYTAGNSIATVTFTSTYGTAPSVVLTTATIAANGQLFALPTATAFQAKLDGSVIGGGGLTFYILYQVVG